MFRVRLSILKIRSLGGNIRIERLIIYVFISIIVEAVFLIVNRHLSNNELEDVALYHQKESAEILGYTLVRLPTIYRKLCGFCIIGCSIILFGGFAEGESNTFTFYFFCGLVIFIGAVYVMLSVWKIKVLPDEDRFIYTTAFGRNYIIRYSDITSYKISGKSDVGPSTYKMTANNKTFIIEASAYNYDVFHNKLIEYGVISDPDFSRAATDNSYDSPADEYKIGTGNADINGSYSLKFPTIYFASAGMICFGSVLILMFSLHNKPASSVSLIEFLSLSHLFLIAGICAVFLFNWRITFSASNNTFVYTSYLGVKHEIKYEDISDCECKSGYIKINQKQATQKIYVLTSCSNYDLFKSQLMKYGLLKEDSDDLAESIADIDDEEVYNDADEYIDPPPFVGPEVYFTWGENHPLLDDLPIDLDQRRETLLKTEAMEKPLPMHQKPEEDTEHEKPQ